VRKLRRRTHTALGILVLGSALAVAADVVIPRLVGRQVDGSVLLATNQTITPVGRQIEFDGRANAMAISPDGKTAAILNGNAQAIVLLNLVTAKVQQTFDGAGGSASFDGITYSPDGKKLYASQTGRIIVADVQADGTIRLAHLVEAPRSSAYTPGSTTSYPGGMALSDDGKLLYVALSRSNALGVLNLEHLNWEAQIPVGNAPHAVVVKGNVAYVSNQGGRLAKHTDLTVDSSGTAIVADATSGFATTGTVSIVDLQTRRERSTVMVGRQPTALLLDGQRLFVANTNSDTVSVIDTQTGKVARTISVKPFAGALSGSSPNGLALTAPDQLAVTLGRNNATAIYSVPQDNSQATTFKGLVPVGYYPTAVAADSTTKRMYVLNGRGLGSVGPDRTSGPDQATNKTAKSVYAIVASLSIIDASDLTRLPDLTAQVLKNNAWDNIPSHQRLTSDNTRQAVPIPERLGQPSLFKHVFYVVKENRTYDQLLGDVKEGNGDPKLVQFGQEVTPNLHALVKRFGLLDNHYDIGTNSADGHQWSTQAFVDDYVEKSYGGFTRSYPFNGGDALIYPSTGFLWDNALRQKKTVRVYGEYVNGLRVYGETVDKTQVDGREMGPWISGQGAGVTEAGTWADFYNDALILRGLKPGKPHLDRLEAHSDVPSLDKLIDRNYPPYHQIIPDQYRLEVWKKDFENYVKNNNLPSLNILALTNDHTAGLSPHYPTPRAMIADNDYALGQMVETISKSPYWKDSIIFVIEDDTQNGVDHVSGQRGPVNVISAYSKPGTYSQYMTQIDFVAAMERILGLPPMNQMDMAVDPTHLNALFAAQPDLTPFQALQPNIKLDEMNPSPVAVSTLQRAWIQASRKMDFNSGPDEADPALLNRAVWYSVKGFSTPYPGDQKVLLPEEVHAYLKSSGQESAVHPDD